MNIHGAFTILDGRIYRGTILMHTKRQNEALGLPSLRLLILTPKEKKLLGKTLQGK